MTSPLNWPVNSASAIAAPLPSSANSRQLVPPHVDPNHDSVLRQSNVFKLLFQRELCPQTKRTPRKFWGKASTYHDKSSGFKIELAKDARQELRSWGEAESLLHLSANYCHLLPPPRSTISVAFSPDGKILASTHGDHTVKITDYQSGTCLKVLRGHRMTPWVFRFHPLYPEILASGSLDFEVRLWDAKTAECVGSRNFNLPITSIAFHALGDILAVASGHKLYIWHYKRRGEASSPSIILKTHWYLRAVHFHPHGAPFLLTAEANDLNSSDTTMTLATSPGCFRYPPPTIYLADSHSAFMSNSGNEFPIISIPFLVWPSISRGDLTLLPQPRGAEMSSNVSHQRGGSSACLRLLTYSIPSGQYELVLSPIQSPLVEEQQTNSSSREMDNAISQPALESMDTDVQAEDRSNQFFPFGDPAFWEFSFVQGWRIGRSQAGQRTMHSQNSGLTDGLPIYNASANASPMVPPVNPSVGSRAAGRSGSRHQSSRSGTRPATGSGDSAGINSIPFEHRSSQYFTTQVQSEVAALAELPYTANLRVWSHDVKNPYAALDTQQCRLMITHAVLYGEMGAQFSPCGRFLAVCVECILPNTDADPSLQGQVWNDVTGASTSPTGHPFSAHQVMHELRIYSLEEATFGYILASQAIRSAYSLTSIQFSPTSDHLLLAYGKRDTSLLKSVVIDGDTSVPVYSILEIYRVSDMELVRVLTSVEDEIEVACFHPSLSGGLHMVLRKESLGFFSVMYLMDLLKRGLVVLATIFLGSRHMLWTVDWCQMLPAIITSH